MFSLGVTRFESCKPTSAASLFSSLLTPLVAPFFSKEFSSTWKLGDEPYYPVNDKRNNELYEKYAEEARKNKNVIFGGRLGQYKYYDMDKVIIACLNDIKKLF